jgi:hypothetical protein
MAASAALLVVAGSTAAPTQAAKLNRPLISICDCDFDPMDQSNRTTNSLSGGTGQSETPWMGISPPDPGGHYLDDITSRTVAPSIAASFYFPLPATTEHTHCSQSLSRS